jgi:NIMA (never in mitosis gene a)-related kinase
MYAMKTIRITELTDRERIEAIKEVKLLASIDSSYIVRYFDSFIHKDSLSIIMEFCNMGDLTRLLKKKKDRGEPHLNNVVVWNLILQILLGLQYLHSMKVLHRDLKSK